MRWMLARHSIHPEQRGALFRQDIDVAAAFVEQAPVSGVTIASITDDKSWSRPLGVVSTPMAYLIDTAGIVRAGVSGTRLPPAASARRFCS